MAITNLQAWADALELVKLPMIDAQLEALTDVQSAYNDLLSAKIQEFGDKFAQHSARITASQARADDAKDTANSALTQIYQVGLDAHTYIETRIQNLRDELNLGLTAVQQYVDGGFAAGVNTQITAQINAALTLIEPIAAEVEAIRDTMVADLADIQNVSSQILDQGLPTQAVLINQIASEIQLVKAQAELTLAGFEYDTLIEALDVTQAKISESLVPLGVSFVQEPAAAWTVDSTTAVLTPKNPVPTAWLITNDPTLGACAELPLAANQTIGQSYPVDFAADRVYQVRVRVRVITSGSSGGVRMKLGISTWAAGVAAQLNVEKELNITPVAASTADRIYTCVFSGNLAKLQAQEYVVGLTASDTAVHLTGSATANKAFFHIRQNSASTTNGQIRVALLEVKDITDAIDAVKVIKTQLQTELDLVSSSLETISFAVSDLNSAVAGINTKLDSRSVPNLVGDAPFAFPIVDYYVPTLGATLSLVTHGQTGPLNTKALRATDPVDGNAGFFTLPYPTGNFTNRPFRFRGKARGSANGIVLFGSAWLYRAGLPDTATNAQLLTLTTTFQPFDIIIKALSSGGLDSDEVRLRLYHSGGPVGCWSEVTDLEIFDVTDSETAQAAIQATLNLLYYTKTQTDSAISEGITTYGAQFYNPTSGQMKASALTDYYTKASSDSAISVAIDSFESEFRDTTSGQIKATALTSYYTKTAADSAIASAGTTLSAATAAKGKVIYSTTTPVAADQLAQNLWIDLTGAANTPKRWSGTAWVSVTDKASADAAAAVATSINANLTTNYFTQTQTNSAISSASTTLSSSIATAQATADGKGKVIYSATAPGAADRLTQNLWIDLTGGANTPKRWDGAAWVAVSDVGPAAAVSANLTNNYYTKTAADSAIAAQITTYDSVLVSPTGYAGMLAANLTNNYYTKTATDSAISSASTTLSSATAAKGKIIYSNTSPLAADQQAQNLWVDTNSGNNTPKRWNGTAWIPVTDKIASDAAAGLVTTNANLATNYYTKTTADTAIASAIDTFETEYFDTLTGQMKASALTGYYTKTTADAAIASADTALKSALEAPTGSIGQAQTAAASAATLAGGKGKVLYQTATPGVADQAAQNLWIDITAGANTPKRWDGSAWVAVTDKVATDAATAAASAATAVTTLSSSLSSTYYTKTAADTAIASANTTLKSAIENPTGTSLGATVSQQASTIATLEGNAAALVALRAKAGTSGAELELVASNTPAGSTSAARISADNIILNGSVTAEHIRAGTIVTDRLAFGSNANMLNNTNFKQGSIGWQEANSDATMDAQVTMAIRNAGESWAGTAYPTLFLVQSGAYAAGYSDIRSVQTNNAGAALSYRDVPVTPGTYYTASAQVSTHRCTGSVIIVFFDSAATQVGAYSTPVANDASSSTNPDVWPQYWIKALAPATAAFASIFIRKNGTLAPEANSYLFLHKPLIVMSHAGATEAPEYSNGVSTFINGSSIRTGSITAASGAIGNLAVDTLQIAGQAVTVFNIAAAGAVNHAPGAGYWLGIVGVGITRTAGYGTLVKFDYAVGAAMDWDMYAVVGDQPWVNLTNLDSNNWTSATLWDGNSAGGYQAYYLWARSRYRAGYYRDTLLGQTYVQPSWSIVRVLSASISVTQVKR